MTDMYQDWSDEKLDEHRVAILTEQERRINLAAIPEQIRALTLTYTDGGGDPADLAAVLEPGGADDA